MVLFLFELCLTFLLTLHVAGKTKQITQMDFYKYRLMVRAHDFSYLHISGRLAQEYFCDMYSKIEEARLQWIRCNNKKSELNCITLFMITCIRIRQILEKE